MSPGRTAAPTRRWCSALHAVATIQARYPGLVVAEAGDASVDRAATAMMGQDFRKAELTSIPITLLLLLIVFGALIAAGIPVLLAGSAVMTTVSLLAIPSRWLPIGQGTSEVVLIIGMAVGVDYTLFYLRREREERAAGASFHDALRTAAATSGRAIVVSGITVMISLAGLLFTGIDMFTGFAIGTICVVGVAVAGSLTALPALLSLLGPWADRARIPFLGKARTKAEHSRLWAALVGRVVRKPLVWGGVAVAALGALALPALGMRIGSPAINLPSSLPVVQTLSMISRDFPGGPAPAQVVVSGPGVASPAMGRALAELRSAAERPAGPIHGPVSALPVGAGHGLLITVPLAGAGKDARSFSAVQTLRGRILARHDRPGRRRAVRRHRGHGEQLRLPVSAPVGRTAGLRHRRRARLRAAAHRVPVARDPAGVDRAEPAVGRCVLRPDHLHLPARAPAKDCSASPPSAASWTGSRCSCSCSCSG